jgi:hypothetical protein
LSTRKTNRGWRLCIVSTLESKIVKKEIAMLTCLIVAGSLWIGDENKMFPTQGLFYFHKFKDSIKVYSHNGSRYGSFVIPKNLKGETIMEVFENCANKSG